MLNQRARVAALLLIAILIVAISACSLDSSSFLLTESPLASPLQAESPLAAPPFTLALPPVTSGMGQVYGRVTALSPGAKGILAGDFYLAPVIYGEPETEGDPKVPFISLSVGIDQTSDDKDADGQFAFYDVPPGEYGIVIYTPIQQFLFPGDVGPLYITVKAGEAINIGEVIIQ